MEQDRNPIERKSVRHRIAAEVKVGRPGRPTYRVEVFDMSPFGCKVEFVERPRLDDGVWIKFENLEPVEGSVCWIDGHIGGVEFEKPINSAVFDHLLARLSKSGRPLSGDGSNS